MKTILTALSMDKQSFKVNCETVIVSTVAFILMWWITGCARLGTMLQPEVDPQIVATDGTLKGAPFDIQSFLNYVKANPHIVGMDTRQSAKGLTKRYESNLLNLKNTRKLYAANRSEENKSWLLRAKETVDRDRGEAVSQLNGNALPDRGQGAPFAPPIGIGPPQGPPTALDTILGRLDGIRAEQASIRAEQLATRAAIGALGKAVWSLTNTNGNTNAPPIPGK